MGKTSLCELIGASYLMGYYIILRCEARGNTPLAMFSDRDKALRAVQRIAKAFPLQVYSLVGLNRRSQKVEVYYDNW